MDLSRPVVVTVLGGHGEMGGRVADLLQARGATVRRAARSTGVDAVTGEGLDEALAGADVVVDCLNVLTQSRRAVAFFAESAAKVCRTAEAVDVRHVVVLSIVNAADRVPRRTTGYYAGKAAQEAVYARSRVPVTLVRTTAWFTLARMFLDLTRVGPVRVVPSMQLQPVHPAAAAGVLADVALGDPPQARRLVQLAGPEVITSAQMAARLARADSIPEQVVPVPLPGAMRTALLPRAASQVTTDTRTFAEWLQDPARARP